MHGSMGNTLPFWESQSSQLLRMVSKSAIPSLDTTISGCVRDSHLAKHHGVLLGDEHFYDPGLLQVRVLLGY